MISELAGLSCSLLWALCSLAFASAGRLVGAAAVNQLRIHMALVTLLVLNLIVYSSPWPLELAPRQLNVLLISGCIGLALGDLCLFQCMALIGPRLGTLLMATVPLMTASIGWLALDERLSERDLLGVVVVSAGVLLVLIDRRGEERWRDDGGPRMPLGAVLLGLGGALGQAVGLVMSRTALQATTAEELPVAPLAATVVRMAAGALGMVVIAVFGRQVKATLRATRDGRAMRLIAIGALFGPVLGVWMSMVAVEGVNARAGIAAALMSLAPVLMIPIARFAYGARVGFLGVVGTLAAVGGALLLL